MQEKIYTVTEATKITGRSRQAIYVAIRKGKLVAVNTGHKWIIKERDFERWQENKFKHFLRKREGKLLFDGIKTFSVSMASKKIASLIDQPFTEQQLYYLLRRGEIKYSLFGATKIIDISEITKYAEKREKLPKCADLE